MGETKQINTKNQSYYLYRNLIDLKNFDAEYLKLTKCHTKSLIFIILDTTHLYKLVIIGVILP